MPPPGESERAASEVVATLRSEACRDPTTVTCQGWSGNCQPAASVPAPRRATHNVRFHRPTVDALVLRFDDEMSADAGLTMTVYADEPRLPSHDVLRPLASWAATLDQAEAASAVDGL